MSDIPRQYDSPTLLSAIAGVLAVCREHGVACGHPHVDAGNVEALLQQGFRWLMPAPVTSFPGLERGRAASGR
jgi:4-hydroxy-2-oxoheptanedioate aldolase